MSTCCPRTRKPGGEISSGDIVVLHEAATAGLAQAFSEAGAWVVWRCHGGTEDLNEHSQLAWSFLEPYLDWANRMVFTRDVYRPPFAPPDSCRRDCPFYCSRLAEKPRFGLG